MRSMLLIFVCALAFAMYSQAQVTPGVSFGKLGGRGFYGLVVYQANGTWPNCTVSPTLQCTKVNTTINATNLAPFNEEISIQLRGPLQMTRIAVYQIVNGQQQLVSNWQPGSAPTNLVFMMAGANDWSICQGSGLGCANASGTGQSPTPQSFNGYLVGAGEMTLMSGVPCNGDCGWYRGTGYHGWAGDKIFVIETSMPTSLNKNDKPAIWSLNAKIPRTAQYGCNCDRSGCGEFDIAEILTDGDTKLYQTLYSYNGGQGSPGWFNRPVNTTATYYVHYSIADNRIYAVNLPGNCFQYPSVLSAAYISNIESLALDTSQISSNPRSNLVGTCPTPTGTPAPTPSPAPTKSPTAATSPAPSSTVTPTPTPTSGPIITGNVTIRSLSTSLYVVANSTTGFNLAASASSSAQAVFTISPISGGYSLWSVFLKQFVAAENFGAQPLIANRATAGGWETFSIVKQSSGYYTFTSSVAGKFVTVLANKQLLANVTVSSSPPNSCLFTLTAST